MKSGGVPQVPQFRPTTTMNPPHSAPVNNTQKNPSGPNSSTEKSVTTEVKDKKDDDEKKTANNNGVTTNADPLGDARNKVQDEIIKEFAAIMATGTMRASEAAALATRRVMQRYGQIAVSQS